MKFVFFAVLGICPGLLVAQIYSTDSAFLARAKDHQRIKYRDFIGANSSLYNGTEYKATLLNIREGGIPYFLSSDWIEGSVVYNGQLYEHIHLQYDIVNNKILTHPFYSFIKMELSYDRIDQFTLADHTFVRLRGISKTENFYDRLTTGRAELYALRKKEVLEEVGGGKITHVLINKTKYYVLLNGKFLSVKNRIDLYKIFPECKAAIKKHLNDKKISFRRNFENALFEGVSVCNKQQAN